MSDPVSSRPAVTMWSASSWATWKQCPYKWKLKAEKWNKPRTRTDSRLAIHGMAGLTVDRLFELWLHRREFSNLEWLEANFEMTWSLIESRQKPKWFNGEERSYHQAQAARSVRILYELLHANQLLNPEMGIQAEYHEIIAPGTSIAGAIDLWTVRPDGRLVVVDFKNAFANSRRSVDQLHFGAMALKRLLGREPVEAGYVCFHPQSAGYRRVTLRDCDRMRLLARLGRATTDRKADRCPAKFNAFTCPKWCEVRFACEEYRSREN